MLTLTRQQLADWTTLRLGGPADRFVEVDNRSDLFEAVSAADADGEPALLLGGGSNLVVADAGFSGTVIRVATAGVAVREMAAGVEVTVEAGESWERLVERAVTEGWVGVEALAGIPGTVGAAPIQNVGAYGQEVADTLAAVEVFDRHAGRATVLPAAKCGFAYRTSRFKAEPGRFVVVGVTFRFQRGRQSAPVRYGELARRLDVVAGEPAAADEVRRVVLELRTAKGMVLDPDDHDTWSAGSFFTNPFVDPAALPAGAPAFDAPGGKVKTSAAWLVERAGFPRGFGGGKVSLSTKHTLALTNRGGAKTADLLALARTVQTGVHERFGIRLQPEPALIGCSLS